MAIESQEIMNTIKESLSELFPKKGIVRHNQYDEAKLKLRQVKTDILNQLAKSPQERSLWETAWPFDD